MYVKMSATSCILLLTCFVCKLNALTPDEIAVVTRGLDWIKCPEGFTSFGSYPSTGSGVTIGSGIDLGQITETVLRKAGVDEPTLAIMHPYFGYTNEAKALASGIIASNLVLTKAKAEEITYKYVVYGSNVSTVALAYGANMSPNGRDVLVSLQHFAGYNGTYGTGTKLAPMGTNWIKQAIADKQGTDSKLIIALCRTIKDCQVKRDATSNMCTDGKTNRFKLERNHAKQKAYCTKD